MLLFHSMTVHKGVPNRSDRLRMSMDVRYQLVSEPFNIDNANPDGQPLSWDEVYADWRSDALKYYWQRLPLTLKPFDRQWFDKRDASASSSARPAIRVPARCCSASWRAMPTRKSVPARRGCSTRCRDRFDVRHYDSIGSTNDEAVRLAAEGAAHGTVVHARRPASETATTGLAGICMGSLPRAARADPRGTYRAYIINISRQL